MVFSFKERLNSYVLNSGGYKSALIHAFLFPRKLFKIYSGFGFKTTFGNSNGILCLLFGIYSTTL